jgi:hypothetical protein
MFGQLGAFDGATWSFVAGMLLGISCCSMYSTPRGGWVHAAAQCIIHVILSSDLADWCGILAGQPLLAHIALTQSLRQHGVANTP